jgi:hypothetical protein
MPPVLGNPPPHETPPAPPRLYVLPAREAAVAVVFRRGPSDWWHLLRWDLDPPTLEGGAWFHGRLYPRRSAVSPDGRLLGSFAWTARPSWDGYYAVSKVPWLRALAVWYLGSTWAAGCDFPDDDTFALAFPPDTPPDRGELPPGMRQATLTRATDLPFTGYLASVQNELRRGWRIVALDQPGVDRVLAEVPAPRPAVKLLLRRDQTDAGPTLYLAHAGHDFRSPSVEGVEVGYVMDEGSRVAALADAAWADWDARGRLLVASHDGSISIREREADRWTTTWERDLRGMEPDPAEAPAWARTW